MSRRPLAVALVHYPIVDRRGDLVTTAVTNLDIHDIARTCRTFGVERYFVITPAAEQQTLLERLLAHWRTGHGAGYNPDRAEALSLVTVTATLEEALASWREELGEAPLPVLTSARAGGISFPRCRQLATERPLLLVFGTGWGLAPALFERGWPVLEPIAGTDGYNHLPVRAAVAIILDRLQRQGQDQLSAAVASDLG
ncbi:MAG: RNA methyltransferase [Desulfuromonadales bacterium]|nr:RNA methyltransferase [Desulfuromonadales bacterium]